MNRRPFVPLLALFALACGAGTSVYIGQNAAFPAGLLIVVKQGGSVEQPKSVSWTKDPDGATVDVKQVVVQGEPGKDNLPAMLSGAIEFSDLPAGTYIVRQRHSDGKDQNCPGTLSWGMSHGTLSGELYSQATGPCGQSEETLAAGDKLKLNFEGTGGDGIVLVIDAK